MPPGELFRAGEPLARGGGSSAGSVPGPRAIPDGFKVDSAMALAGEETLASTVALAQWDGGEKPSAAGEPLAVILSQADER
jgi:hypothetical protein